MRRAIKLPVVFLGLCLYAEYGCIERFDPDVVQAQGILVVEALVTNANTAYTVRLSRTRPLNSGEAIPEESAVVHVIDPGGVRFLFTESSPGLYQSDPATFQGVIGDSYQLDIVTDDGKHYSSEKVRLKASPAIDSLYYTPELRFNDNGQTMHGVKILLDSHDPSNETRYYRYEWEATYEVKVPYPDQASDVDLQKCYGSDTGRTIVLASTFQLAEDRVSQLEINFVSTGSYRLRSLYSILVKQYALEENSYRYWSELQKTSESLGTLFDPQPYELSGNVKNLNNHDEPVLGYFDASTVTEARLFINWLELLDLEYPTNGCFGNLDTVPLSEAIPRGFCLAMKGPFGAGWNLAAPDECCDCRLYGTLEKPDFWPR